MHFSTLDEYCKDERQSTKVDARILSMLPHIFSSAKILSKEVAHVACTCSLGATGDINIQGECVQKLDILTHTLFTNNIKKSKEIAGISSEEIADFISFEENRKGSYLVNFDPLDGSSNIDVNINVGTIFSILKRKSLANTQLTENDFLQPMNTIVGAGYILYGSSTMLVLSLGNGVQGFTFSEKSDQFLLTHPNITIPEHGHIYSVNEGYTRYWDSTTKTIVNYFKEQSPPSGGIYSHRYVGSLVADIHRTLIYGGIFLYPTLYPDGKKKDKLRLLCESIPLSYIIEQAGGKATNGIQPIATIIPKTLHARSALYIGSPYEMDRIATLLSHSGK